MDDEEYPMESGGSSKGIPRSLGRRTPKHRRVAPMHNCNNVMQQNPRQSHSFEIDSLSAHYARLGTTGHVVCHMRRCLAGCKHYYTTRGVDLIHVDSPEIADGCLLHGNQLSVVLCCGHRFQQL